MGFTKLSNVFRNFFLIKKTQLKEYSRSWKQNYHWRVSGSEWYCSWAESVALHNKILGIIWYKWYVFTLYNCCVKAYNIRRIFYIVYFLFRNNVSMISMVESIISSLSLILHFLQIYSQISSNFVLAIKFNEIYRKRLRSEWILIFYFTILLSQYHT